MITKTTNRNFFFFFFFFFFRERNIDFFFRSEIITTPAIKVNIFVTYFLVIVNGCRVQVTVIDRWEGIGEKGGRRGKTVGRGRKLEQEEM